jgi:hypothetical protein
MTLSTVTSPLRRDNAERPMLYDIGTTMVNINNTIVQEDTQMRHGDRDAGTRIVPGVKVATDISLLDVDACVLWRACCATTMHVFTQLQRSDHNSLRQSLCRHNVKMKPGQ